MASYRKRGSRWEALVVRKIASVVIRKSGSFSTKAEAQAWAARIETEIVDQKHRRLPNKTFGDLMTRYRQEVSPTKRGVRWETLRINALLNEEVAAVPLAELSACHFAAWRDRRLKLVSNGTVLREWTLLSSACTKASREWGWLLSNPLTQVKRPSVPPSRDRRISQDEIDRIVYACGDNYTTVQSRVGLAFLFAIETAMRAGEIVGLKWEDVNPDTRVVRVGDEKTISARRGVALTIEALRILNLLPRINEQCFVIESAQLDALFRKAKARALIDDLHFHDTRHEGITRLAQKLNVLELARMVGHRDLRMLQIYYNETPENIAQRLN